jgi:hypothetical protein
MCGFAGAKRLSPKRNSFAAEWKQSRAITQAFRFDSHLHRLLNRASHANHQSSKAFYTRPPGGVRPNEHSVCEPLRYPVFAMSRLFTSSANRAMTLIEVLIMILVMTIAAVMTIRFAIP